MNKREYLDLLRYYLKELPKGVVDDIIFDYEDHFRIGIESGKTEKQISEELGSVKSIANQFLEGEGRTRKTTKVEVERPKKSVGMIILSVIGLIVLSPFILTAGALLVAIIATIVSVFIAIVAGGFGILLAAVAVLLSMLPSFMLPSEVIIPMAIYSLHPITSICLIVGLVALSIVIVSLSIEFIKWVFKSIKNIYISIKWKIEKRLNRDER